MVLLAAFGLVVSERAQQEDVVVGTPAAARVRPELEPLIGLFVNTVPLRFAVRRDATLPELLATVRAAALAAFAHQDFPFDRLVAGLDLPRDSARNPVVQVVFALQNTPVPQPGTAPFEMKPFWLEREPAQSTPFDLELHVLETDGGLECSFTYTTALFDSFTIMELASAFEAALRRAVDVLDVGERPPVR
jgi:non-ribosomal peptide synthetase component F